MTVETLLRFTITTLNSLLFGLRKHALSLFNRTLNKSVSILSLRRAEQGNARLTQKHQRKTCQHISRSMCNDSLSRETHLNDHGEEDDDEDEENQGISCQMPGEKPSHRPLSHSLPALPQTLATSPLSPHADRSTLPSCASLTTCTATHLMGPG